MKKNNITAWDRVLLAREVNRPKALDYIENIFEDFIEFHGDRLYRDDKSIIGGIAKIDDFVVTVIGEQKGKTTKEVGDTASFLFSNMSNAITGEVIHVDNGFSTVGV